jgi:hypothetical protein
VIYLNYHRKVSDAPDLQNVIDDGHGQWIAFSLYHSLSCMGRCVYFVSHFDIWKPYLFVVWIGILAGGHYDVMCGSWVFAALAVFNYS